MRFVIIGGGYAGGSVAGGLREQGYDGELIVLGDEPGPPFARPPLSKEYLRSEDLEGWMPNPPDWYEANKVDLRTDSQATGIDPSRGSVQTSSGEIPCDAVCIAAGARPVVPDIPGKDLDGVFTLRRKADSDTIRAAAQAPGAKALIGGMSFIGAEVAASLRKLGCAVTAVFPGSGPLASTLGNYVAARLAEIHGSEGVELVPEDKVTGFEGAGKLEQVVTESGKKIECTFAVVGLGVRPNTEFLAGSGIEVDDGVMVDAYCRTNLPTVFAAGDIARHQHPLFGPTRVEHYNNAEKQGRYVAGVMLGSREPFDYIHSFWSDQYDHNLEYVGYAPVWDEFFATGDPQRFLGFYLKDGLLKAALGLDRGGDPEDPASELAAVAENIRSSKRVDIRKLKEDYS